jgi:hypothetical protein
MSVAAVFAVPYVNVTVFVAKAVGENPVAPPRFAPIAVEPVGAAEVVLLKKVATSPAATPAVPATNVLPFTVTDWPAARLPKVTALSSVELAIPCTVETVGGVGAVTAVPNWPLFAIAPLV